MTARNRRTGRSVSRRAVLVAAPVTGMLAACVPGQGAEQVAPGPFKGTATIRFTTVFPDQPITSVIQQQVDRFAQKNPSITVKFEPAASTGDWLEKRKIEVAAGDAVELSHHRANAMGELASLGILADLDAYLKRDGKAMKVEDYWPGALEAGRWKSKQVGLVYRGVTVQGVIYSLKLFQQAGQPSPLDLYARSEWTWQRLRELAKPLTSNVHDPNPANRIFGTSNWIMASFFTCAVPLAAWGHEILTKDGKLAPTSPAAVEALEFFQTITCRERTAPSRELDGYEGDANGHLNTGRLGTMTVSHDTLQRLRPMGWAYDFAPPPKQKTTASLLNAEQLCVLQHGKQKDAAWEYLKFAASQDEQAQMSKAFGNAPPFKGIFDAFGRDAEAFKDIKGARYLPDIMKIARPLPIELTTKFSDFQRLWEQQVISTPLYYKCDGSSARDAYDRFVREANQLMA